MSTKMCILLYDNGFSLTFWGQPQGNIGVPLLSGLSTFSCTSACETPLVAKESACVYGSEVCICDS